MKYENILFDLDGTLIDPKLGISRCVTYALEKLGYQEPTSEEIDSMIGPAIKDSFLKHFGQSNEHLVQNAIKFYRERYASHGIYENSIYPGILDLLESLKGKAKLWIATAKPEIFAKQIAKQLQFEHYFIQIAGSELDGRKTNKIDLLSHMKTELGLKGPSVMIGDRKYDITSAKHHEMIAIGVSWGYGTESELLESGADFMVKNANELYSYLI